jgi:serine/threonine protein kinase/TolA-binding protein
MRILPVSKELIGQTLGHYRIVGQLGAGGMGVVYRAQDLKLERLVALKVLPAGNASDTEAIERFRREARTASSLNHTNICTIYGFDEHDGQLYLAMELLDGDPLDKRLAGRPLDMRTVFEIATQVADALDAAHVGGVLHRDVKPANIFLTRRGTVKVLDFGLAKLAPDFRHGGRHLDARNQTMAPEHFSSVVGTTVGTIAYMSPEQARGDDVDARTDLFSFGVVLYEMATGRQSFPGNTTAVVFDGILNRDPVPASSLNAAIPGELDRIISKALEKDRSLRYQTAADICADLKRLRRDSSSRQSAPMAAASTSPDAPTVVMSAGSSAAAGSGVTASAYAAASASTSEFVANEPAPSPSGSAQAATRTRSTVTVTAPGTKTSWLVGVVVAVLVIAGVAGAIGAFVASRNSTAAPPADSATSSQPAPAPAPAPEPTPASPAPPTSASSLPAAPVVPAPPPTAPGTKPAATGATATPPASPATAASSGAVGGTGITRPADRKAAGAVPPVKPIPTAPTTAPAAPAPPAPAPSTSREAEATQRLEVARAKVASNLNDQALTDLRQIVADYPGTRASIEAAFLAGELHEKVGRNDDAMAAYVEVESRFKGDARAADAKLRRSGLLARSRQPRADVQSRDLLNEVVRDYPGTPQANFALQTKLKMETERRDLREIDPVLKVEVPAVMVTLRTIIEQFPNAPQTMPALNRLATMLSAMNRHAEAAAALEDLGARFPGNPMNVWFRLGETYERRLNDRTKANEAYAKVPKESPSYVEAQKRLKRK